jgi:hypothetical protein
MKQNKKANPLDIRSLRPYAVMLVKNALPNAPDQGQRLVEFHDVFTQRILTVYKYSNTTPTCWQEAFSAAMLTRIYGEAPAYPAFSPPILRKRHVSVPHTQAEEQAIQFKIRPNQTTADTDLSKIGGSNPEYTAHMPSTSRYAS